jgi:hypothetical protein
LLAAIYFQFCVPSDEMGCVASSLDLT